ncbi:19630_t:CDS:2, partial [Cetraspora pellucida]
KIPAATMIIKAAPTAKQIPIFAIVESESMYKLEFNTNCADEGCGVVETIEPKHSITLNIKLELY